MTRSLTCPNCGHDFKTDKQENFIGTCQKCGHVIKIKAKNEVKNGQERESIRFFLNGELHTVGNNYPLTMTLNQYLRDVQMMKGTKVMCREGGCGACLVHAERFDSATQKWQDFSVNSCLFLLYSCDNLRLTTVEGLGSKSKGYHEIQKRLAEGNGSQCGFCSAGMVMNMYSLLKKNQKPSKAEIEASYDGNICRCTGYRPILSSMKTFAADENPIDIEELCKLKCLHRGDKDSHSCDKKKCHIINGNNEWFTPSTLDELYELLSEHKSTNYRFVGGNTGAGVYKNDGPYNYFIDLKHISDLSVTAFNGNELTIGANVSLTDLIEIFNEHSKKSGFEYLSTIALHIAKIANVAVRNTSTWSGNLSLKHVHKDFPSDVFISFKSVNATLTLIGPEKTDKSADLDLEDFLKVNMNGKLIYSVTFRPFDSNKTFFKTYKIMPRHRNAHAYVNAGFRFSINSDYKVESKPLIIYGGVNEDFLHAYKTEEFLNGKHVNNQDVLKEAFEILSSELHPEFDPALATPEYRKSLAISLFYKFILFVNDKNLSPRLKSGYLSVMDERGVSDGKQSYPSNPELYPVTKAIPRLNAYSQASGEASYVYDMNPFAKQLYGAFIRTDIGNCELDKVDSEAAQKMPGVVRIFFAKDIPGKNNFVPYTFFSTYEERLFAEDIIEHAGQTVGLVVAETHEQAVQAAKAVKITYKNIKKPILSIKEAIEEGNFYPKTTKDHIVGNADEAIANAPNKLEGEFEMNGQHHFHIEGQVSIATCSDEGIDIYSATQWTDFVLAGVSNVLGVSANQINVIVKQLGGAFGGKVTRPNLAATGAALACKILERPVRVALDLDANLESLGKRPPWLSKYKVGFGNNGKILGINLEFFADRGSTPNDNLMSEANEYCENVYNIQNWKVVSNLVKTNTPSNTTMRSIETFPTINSIEYVLEHIAKVLNLDHLQVKLVNMFNKNEKSHIGMELAHFNVQQIINELKVSSEYEQRLKSVQEFNRNNRWKKKGISVMPLRWPVASLNAAFNATVTIYAHDGSVMVEHGGVEMGQGVNTKVAQVCAYALKVPIENISVKYSSSRSNPNGRPSGGSITTECVSAAVLECCKKINSQLDPIRKTLGDSYKWHDLVIKALFSGVDLSVRHTHFAPGPIRFGYDVYGAAVSEVLVDILTGETQMQRVDILYDAGDAPNTLIDIGQAEGAFMMGVGFWMFEKPKYDPKTGKCLTNGTWEYKPPLAQDIPVDFRVTLLNNNPNPLGVMGSKSIGEPPLNLSPSVFFSIKKAIEAARKEINKDSYFQLNSPATFDVIQQHCLVDFSEFKLKE